MTLVLDAGARIAVERGDRELVALIKQELLVIGQVWRGGSRRQATSRDSYQVSPLFLSIESSGVEPECSWRARGPKM